MHHIMHTQFLPYLLSKTVFIFMFVSQYLWHVFCYKVIQWRTMQLMQFAMCFLFCFFLVFPFNAFFLLLFWPPGVEMENMVCISDTFDCYWVCIYLYGLFV